MPGSIKGRGAIVAPLRPLFDLSVRLLALAGFAGRGETSPHSHAASTGLAEEFRPHADGMRVRWGCPPSEGSHPALQSVCKKSSFTHDNSLLVSFWY